MQPLPTPLTSAWAHDFPSLAARYHPRQLLDQFRAWTRPSLCQAFSPGQKRFYDRVFSPLVVLWYLVFQRLSRDGTLDQVVSDLKNGGADALTCRGKKPLSQRLKSSQTASYSDARQAFPLALLQRVFLFHVQMILTDVQGMLWHGLQVVVLDGTTIRARPWPGVRKKYRQQRNQTGKNYWVLMRAVGAFCLRTGLVVGTQLSACTVGEQTLACQLISQAQGTRLFLGDTNFGIHRVASTARTARAHVLLRLSAARAKKILGRQSGHSPDLPVLWSPTRRDRSGPFGSTEAIPGRLLTVRLRRPGAARRTLYLFTTLTDTQTFPLAQLVELYGMRWQAELNFRYLKTQMRLQQLECKSAEMMEKEWYAGLIAYHLIRSQILQTATEKKIDPLTFSFSSTRRRVERWIRDLGKNAKLSLSYYQDLTQAISQCLHPHRQKPRPPEPRLKRHLRETFGPLRGSRAQARKNITPNKTKS